MKTIIKFFALSSLLALGSSAFADTTLKLSNGIYSNGSNGGAYTVSKSGLDLSDYSSLVSNLGGTSNSFETFCLEPNETFTSGSTYSYTIDSKGIVYGGGVDKHSPGAGDPISVGTAWLYSLYASGKLDDADELGAAFSYAAPDPNKKHPKKLDQVQSNLDLQRAIWSLEDESGKNIGISTAITNLLVAKFGDLEKARADATFGEYGVYVLNLTSNHGRTLNQSQLYYNVPESGATIAFLGLALAGLLGLRRKFAK